MSDEKREKISSTYVVDEETETVVCGHRVTHKDGETGELEVYAVTSTHDFSELSPSRLLKLASMQAKIKRKGDMGDRAHADGTAEFVYAWTDEDVDGARKSADPVKAAEKAVEKLTAEQIAAIIEKYATS